jgi:hypothetical protein
VAYYFLGVLRDIVDRLTATEGTDVNWKEMGKLIAEVDKLDMFLEENDAGEVYLGRSYGLVHTLNWSNTTKKFMVNVFIFSITQKCNLLFPCELQN